MSEEKINVPSFDLSSDSETPQNVPRHNPLDSLDFITNPFPYVDFLSNDKWDVDESNNLRSVIALKLIENWYVFWNFFS